MTLEEAKRVARKYVKDEISVLELTRDILRANTDGYKEAHTEMNECLARIQSKEPRTK